MTFISLLALQTESAPEGSLVGLAVFVTIALGASFLCSVLEAVLLSTTASHVELAVKRGSGAGKVMRHLTSRENIDRSIAAILTLNTIAHTVGAAGAGAEASAYWGDEYIGLIGAVLTILILVVSEIIPKTLGAVYWKPLMGVSAYTTAFLVKVLFPIVWACQSLTDLLKPKSSEPVVTRSELEVLARMGQEEGTLDPRETRVVRNLLRLNKVQAKDIMTPRTVLFALPAATTVAEVAAGPPMVFSRIPIFESTRDEIDKFALRFEILAAAAAGESDKRLGELGRALKTVPPTVSVSQLISDFITQQEHIFLVIDEYGGTAGIVTLEDCIESLIGAEITDESDLVADMQEMARKRAERRHTRFKPPELPTPPPQNPEATTEAPSNEAPGGSNRFVKKRLEARPESQSRRWRRPRRSIRVAKASTNPPIRLRFRNLNSSAVVTTLANCTFRPDL